MYLYELKKQVEKHIHVLYLSCNVLKSKITAKLYEKSRNKPLSKHFQGCPVPRLWLYCCRFLSFSLHEAGIVIVYS